MQADELSDERLDEVLRRQPRWEPPRGFARVVIARMPTAGRGVLAPRPGRLAVVFRAIAVGALGASVTYAAGLVLFWATATLLPGAISAALASEMLLEIATLALIEHAPAIAWVSAIVTLSIAAAITGRVREWI